MQRRPLTALVLAAALAVPALAACGGGEGAPSLSRAQAAATAPAPGSDLEPAAFAAAAKRSGTTILDVRTPAEYAQGHLPGAVNVDVSSPEFMAQIGRLDPTKAYAVYCHSGSRSAAAVSMMAQQGFAAAYDLAGGLQAWQDAGGEVVTGS